MPAPPKRMRATPFEVHLVSPLRHWALRAVFSARLEASGQPWRTVAPQDVQLPNGFKR